MTTPNSLEAILAGIGPVDQSYIHQARQHTAQLVMPTRALGRMHEMAERCCGIQKTRKPSVSTKSIVVMAGDHGIVGEGVSAYPQEVTTAMVHTFLAGGAGINVLARQVDAQVWIVDMGIKATIDPLKAPGGERLVVRKIGPGTDSFVQGPAMSRDQALRSIMTGFAYGSEVIGHGVELLGTGDMGIGNTTPSAAIGAVMTGASLEEMVGRGTGVDDKGLSHKIACIEKGLDVNQPDPNDAVGVLATVGGFEIGGIAGLVLSGAYHRRPVVIDGFISTAGALIAQAICPQVVDYLFAGHQSEELGHRVMLGHLGLKPILDLGMRLGEGTGAAMAMAVIQGAVGVFNEMMTFEEAGVPGKDN